MLPSLQRPAYWVNDYILGNPRKRTSIRTVHNSYPEIEKDYSTKTVDNHSRYPRISVEIMRIRAFIPAL